MAMNRTIKLLMFSDIFTATGFGLIAPILAIFIKEDLVGGTIFAAGFASTLFYLTKSSIQIPLAKYIDKNPNQKRMWLIVGTFLIALVPFLYMFSKNITQIYIAEIIYGMGAAASYPVWLGLFSTNLDKKHECFEWSIYSTSIGLGAAATAAIGAAIASYIGFIYTFALVGAMSLIGCGVLFMLHEEDIKKKKIKICPCSNKKKLLNHRH